MPEPLRVIAVTRKPDSASFEHRIGDYVGPLAERGIDVDVRVLPHGFVSQRRFVGKLANADAIWWHRHLLQSMLVSRLAGLGVPIVFDYDDPIVHASAGGYRASGSRKRRFGRLLSRCRVAVAASSELAQYSQPFCDDVRVLPMPVSIPETFTPMAQRDGLTLLWLGGKSTQAYLDAIRKPLAALADVPGLRLRLVAHEPMTFGDLPVDYRPWSFEDQEAALQECSIGLNPMPDTPWTRGKCPYKVLQYLGYGMPFVGSAVGENKVAAGDGERGLCPESPDAWADAIRQLVHDDARRERMGLTGREYVIEHHAQQRLVERLAGLFREVVAR